MTRWLQEIFRATLLAFERTVAMKIRVPLLVGLCAAVQSHAAWSMPPRFLRCDMPMQIGSTGTVAQSGPRIFRIAPNSLEEWSVGDREFGPNLCDTFSCRSDAQKLEGSLTMASVAFNIGIDHATGRGYWRAKGASNLPRVEGACDLVADPSPSKE